MDLVNWIILSLGALCIGLVLFILWLGPPSRNPEFRSNQ